MPPRRRRPLPLRWQGSTEARRRSESEPELAPAMAQRWHRLAHCVWQRSGSESLPLQGQWQCSAPGPQYQHGSCR